jgi:phage baseplate assembly protein W
MAFIVHPVLNDIVPLYDIDAIKNAVKTLVLTSRFDTPFHPEIGTGISRLLFESVDPFTALSLKQEIENVLLKYEPRIVYPQVSVFDDSDRNAYQITITFAIAFAPTSPIEVSFYLNRIH